MRLKRCQASFFIQQRLPDSASIPAPGIPQRGQRHLYSAAQRLVSQSPALPSGGLWRRFPSIWRGFSDHHNPFPRRLCGLCTSGCDVDRPLGREPRISVSPPRLPPEEAYPLCIASHVHLLTERDMSLKTCRQHRVGRRGPIAVPNFLGACSKES